MRSTKFVLGTLALFVAAVLGVSPAMGQQYPTKPVRIIVPFAPGGGSDFIARFVAQRLTDALGKQVIVENKPGAGGVLGIEQGIKAAPDGYTLTLIASSYTVNPSVYKLNFDPVNDITPIIQMSQGPLLIVVPPSLPVKNTRELIALARSKPGQVTQFTAQRFFASEVNTAERPRPYCQRTKSGSVWSAVRMVSEVGRDVKRT